MDFPDQIFAPIGVIACAILVGAALTKTLESLSAYNCSRRRIKRLLKEQEDKDATVEGRLERLEEIVRAIVEKK